MPGRYFGEFKGKKRVVLYRDCAILSFAATSTFTPYSCPCFPPCSVPSPFFSTLLHKPLRHQRIRERDTACPKKPNKTKGYARVHWHPYEPEQHELRYTQLRNQYRRRNRTKHEQNVWI